MSGDRGARCPQCSTMSHWTAEIILPPLVPGADAESIWYYQCPRCSRIWVPAAPNALWPPRDLLLREGAP